MRIWSLHPQYLDAKGLVALWRESLLAQAVLAGKTRGYLHHPQLLRFRQHAEPLDALAYYLSVVYDEGQARGYHFDGSKFTPVERPAQIEVAQGQMDYEWGHLLAKLERRDPQRFARLQAIGPPEPHPLFRVVAGGVAEWEKIAK